jgi:hypothetical protein
MINTRVCSTCKIEKPLSEFHKDTTHGGGYQYYCKSCRAVRPPRKSPQTIERKICNNCGVEKPVTEFYSSKRDGISHVCKKCEKDLYGYKKVENPKPRGRKPTSVCNLIKMHHEEMRDDPEHLSTDFLKNLLRVDCPEEPL